MATTPATATAAADLNRVLVVDDEPNIVDVVSMALRFQGFTGGSVVAANALDGGARFTVRLPASVATASPDEQPAHA
jgi:CheY-like chemotaxis protein